MRQRMKNVRLLLIAATTGLATAACASSVTSAPGAAPAPSGGSSSASASSANVETVGHGFKFTDPSGNAYYVYLTKVIDPAHGANSFMTPDKGDRFVGAVFTIKGVSGTSADDANNDADLVGSNGQTYTADFSSIAGYTNFNSGQFNVSPGVVSVGAVTFQVPRRVKVNEIQWTAASGFGGAPGTWKVR
jgi:hypothetical protein